MFKFIILGLLHILITISMAALFFVILPHNGDYWGVLIASVWNLIALTLGDRLLLSSLKAKRLGASSDLVQKIANLKALKRFGRRFEVFISKELDDNVFMIDSYLRSPAIVIGVSVLKTMREEDLDKIMSIGINRIESGDWRFVSLSTQMLSIFATPMLFFSLAKQSSAAVKLIGTPCDFLLSVTKRIAGLGDERSKDLRFIHQAYPQLWSEVRPRTWRILIPFMSRLIGTLLLIPPNAGSILERLQSDQNRPGWENA